MSKNANTLNGEVNILKGVTIKGVVLRIGHENTHRAHRYFIALMAMPDDGGNFNENESYFLTINMGMSQIAADPFPCFHVLEKGDILSLNFDGHIHQNNKIMPISINSYTVQSPGARYEIDLKFDCPSTSPVEVTSSPSGKPVRDEWEEF